MSNRKQRITKAQADAFSRWYNTWDGRDDDHTIKFIIDHYKALSNVEVSRTFVSNVRRGVHTPPQTSLDTSTTGHDTALEDPQEPFTSATGHDTSSEEQ